MSQELGLQGQREEAGVLSWLAQVGAAQSDESGWLLQRGGKENVLEVTMRSNEHISPASLPSNPECQGEKTATTWEGC